MLKNKGISDAAIVVAVIITVISILGYYHFIISEEEELSIASFEKEILDENISNYVSIYIEDYGITGDEVWVRGTVNYIGPPDMYLGGSQGNVGMSIRESGDKNLDVNVYYWSGQLGHGGINPPIDTDSEAVPHLGGSETSYPSSFDFSLSCNCE